MLPFINVYIEDKLATLMWSEQQEGNKAWDLTGLFQSAGLDSVNYQSRAGAPMRVALMPAWTMERLFSEGTAVSCSRFDGHFDEAFIAGLYPSPRQAILFESCLDRPGTWAVSSENLAAQVAVVVEMLKKKGVTTMARTSSVVESSSRDPGARLVAAARRIQAEEKISYSRAFERARKQDPETFKAYLKKQGVTSDGSSRKKAGDELAGLAQKLQAKEGGSWSVAFEKVCEQNPALYEQYIGG